MGTRPARRASPGKKSGRREEEALQEEGLQGQEDDADITTTRTRITDDKEEDHGYIDDILGSVFGSLGGLGALAGGAVLARRLKRSRRVQIPEVSLKSEIKFKNTRIK